MHLRCLAVGLGVNRELDDFGGLFLAAGEVVEGVVRKCLPAASRLGDGAPGEAIGLIVGVAVGADFVDVSGTVVAVVVGVEEGGASLGVGQAGGAAEAVRALGECTGDAVGGGEAGELEVGVVGVDTKRSAVGGDLGDEALVVAGGGDVVGGGEVAGAGAGGEGALGVGEGGSVAQGVVGLVLGEAGGGGADVGEEDAGAFLAQLACGAAVFVVLGDGPVDVVVEGVVVALGLDDLAFAVVVALVAADQISPLISTLRSLKARSSLLHDSHPA